MLSEIELSNEAFTTEGLVADPSARCERRTAGSNPGGRGLTDHGVEADSLHSQFTRIECLAGSNERRISVAVGQANLAVLRTEERDGIARAIIPGVAHQLGAELIVSHLPEDVPVALRPEVIELVDTAVSGEGQDAFFGKQIVQFELSELDIEPRAAEQIVEPAHYRFKVKRGCVVGRGQHVEREVLLQCAARVEVEAAQVKAGRRNALNRRTRHDGAASPV